MQLITRNKEKENEMRMKSTALHLTLVVKSWLDHHLAKTGRMISLIDFLVLLHVYL